jgi:two-component system response regulator ArlR
LANDRILIIDDDRNSVRFLELELCHEGYSVEKAYDGVSGLQLAQEKPFDLIILDIMMPGMDGMEVLRRLRLTKTTPVIMLTAKDSVSDKVKGLDTGADDYLTKPFAIEELLARIRVLLKKHGNDGDREPQEIRLGNLTVNCSTRSVTYGSAPIQLTKREFDLLVYLLRNCNVVCTRDRLMEKVWGYAFRGETNLVDVYIRYLRNKIDYRFDIDLIRTIRGVGYIIKSNVEN